MKHFIEDCRIKQDSILKAGLDTAKETTLPSVEDILCNVGDMVDEDGKYTNAWNITDNYLSDPLEMHKDNDYVLLRDPDENVNQVWTASGKFLSTVQLENETVDEAMEEYYHNISKGDIEL